MFNFTPKQFISEGPGIPDLSLLKGCGSNVIIEDGVRIFHPETITLGDNVYIGHDTILKGYYATETIIGSNVWIGQQCFIMGAGGLTIGDYVGIGPQVKIHPCKHENDRLDVPTSFQKIIFSPITIEEDVNIGIGAMIMAGVTLHKGCMVGTNSVVTKSFSKYSVLAGVPAKLIRKRN
ncbi:acyltransferase [Maridesulfovibrio hydrothermalis]|uniref:Putative transferase hexapeptide repeat containing protein n=1 Tax=Maridesulfovibrio hydrothermalis AM13 = DSM 14728 TaxID=1121451 RepID=L0RAH2_9BACT|nr:acyltransferase [Maridesulfovibrio hydrothermalis]CCO23212.1 putative transferase hexapeptide repeat containing protein [Maridesulfovibrio hydrothermalis AM13 = DSM 14728]